MQAGVRGSIVVSISAYHADDPGSIPGRGVFIEKVQVARLKKTYSNRFSSAMATQAEQ